MKTNVEITGGGDVHTQETQANLKRLGHGICQILDLKDPYARDFIRAVAKEWDADLDSERMRVMCDVFVYFERFRSQFPDTPQVQVVADLSDTRMEMINQTGLAVDYLGDIQDLFQVIRKLAEAGDVDSIKIVAKRGDCLADEAFNAFDYGREQAVSAYETAYGPLVEGA